MLKGKNQDGCEMKIMKIISASRRTDIPAFYAKWLMNRIEKGFAQYRNPFNQKLHTVSLKSEDVACFIFWSKNFKPFFRYSSFCFLSLYHSSIQFLWYSCSSKSKSPIIIFPEVSFFENRSCWVRFCLV